MMEIEEMILVGENDYDYQFAVGRMGEWWIGCAIGTLENGDRMMFLFPEVSEDGLQMGMRDRDQAIRLTTALADDPEQSYGGLQRCFVEPELRGKLDDFRCDHCDRVGCNGRDCQDDWYPDDYPQDLAGENEPC